MAGASVLTYYSVWALRHCRKHRCVWRQSRLSVFLPGATARALSTSYAVKTPPSTLSSSFAHSTVPDNVDEAVADGTIQRKRSTHTTWKFVDKVQIEVKGGRGGNGCVSFEVLSPGRKRPSGGSGGKGGNVFVVADRGLTGMKFQTFHFNARDGTHGGSSGLTGRRGEDVHVRVPLGTIVAERVPVYHSFPPSSSYRPPSPPRIASFQEREQEEDDADIDEDEDADSLTSNESTLGDPDDRDGDDLFDDDIDLDLSDDQDEDEEEDEDDDKPSHSLHVLRELNTHGESFMVAEGGLPGIGNAMMSGSASQRNRSVPLTKLPGHPGQARSLLLELKIIADVGLVGYPNAGKSTLLRALSNARPKVAPYPFTTLHPSVGVVDYSDSGRITVADIPGLIEGAHEDRGLGHDFLRHIERTKALLYVIDGAALEGRQPAADLSTLMRELELYDASLLSKPALVFVNKADVTVRGATALKKLEQLAKRSKMQVLRGSAKEGAGMGALAERLRGLLEQKVAE